MRIIQVSNCRDLTKIMREINVEPYGIKIMLPKGISHLARINSLPSISANILKQEMLSLGAEAAIAKGALTGKAKKTDCLIMGTLSQFNLLCKKLSKQPFGLNKLADELACGLKNYQDDEFSLCAGGYKLKLRRNKPLIMGIVNLTPDSFSGNGLYREPCLSGRRARTKNPACLAGRREPDIVDYAQRLIRDGADIIDIGGESSRPHAKPVSAKEESARTIPIIKILAKKIKIPISIDTYKPQVARRALDNGAVIVNDITGLRNAQMRRVISRHKAGAIIMHMKGNPATMQDNPRYESLMDEIIGFLDKAVKAALDSGIDKNKIIIDPGIGFAKTLKHNLGILRGLAEFKILGLPILVGPSRKSFIGKILNAAPCERLSGTIAACVLAVNNGANIVRVHDVKEVSKALKVTGAILN